jgi:cephalosporin-C deacetylase-like acetyl esterase
MLEELTKGRGAVMRWPAAKKTPLVVKYLGYHCGCDVRRFMLWFNTHEMETFRERNARGIDCGVRWPKISTGDS